MQCVDQIKIPPHEPVTAIRGCEAALGDAAPGIKLAAGGEAVLPERLRRHAAGLKWNPVVAVALIEPPIFVEQAALVLQPRVERRAGKGREMIERCDVERVLLRERDGFGEAFRRVAVVAEDERAIDADAMLCRFASAFSNPPRMVLNALFMSLRFAAFRLSKPMS